VAVTVEKISLTVLILSASVISLTGEYFSLLRASTRQSPVT
jgi:hypothetical protein